jgi:chitin disaccharide deacetylase
MEKRLIINADDFGLSYGITDGIVLTHRKGLLTSTSLMVNQPATEYAVRRAPEVPNLGIGIHLNLTEGRPVLPKEEVPTLVNAAGEFVGPSEMGRRLLRWEASPPEIEAEFRAQIQKMKSLRLQPTHADSHHRIHMYPAAARAFYRAVTSEGIRRARAPRKRYWPSNGRLGGPHSGPLYRRIAAKSYLEFLQSIVFRGLDLPDAGVTFHPKYGNNPDQLSDAWQSTFEFMPDGAYELWCHPGFLQPGFSETDSLSDRREQEIAILLDPKLRDIAVRRKLRLISFSQL